MKLWKVLPIVLAVALILGGCGKTAIEPDSTDTSETAPAVPTVDLSNYKIVYSMKDGVAEAARALANDLEAATGTKLSVVSDSSIGSDKNVFFNTDPEILIGKTDRDLTGDISDELTNNYSYIIRQVENKFVIMGASKEATVKATQVFCDMVKETGKLAIEEGCNVKTDYLLEKYPEGSPMHTVVNNYRVVYSTKGYTYADSVAKSLTQTLTGCSDKTIRPYDNMQAAVDKEILIGYTNRAESAAAMENVGFYDYRLAVKGNKIVVAGGSEVALRWATDILVEKLYDGTLDLSKDSEIFYDFDATINPIAKDFSLFTPNWYGTEYTTPDWLRADKNGWLEKAYALCGPTNGTSRVTSQVHRGDVAHYPEGSIESVASCIWAGMDVIEFDIHLTKDGVAILHHDDSLGRMTNATSFAGKEGYPQSTKISDWTYDQIRSLSMKNGLGDNTELTSYKVPTLYEALMVCADRIFVQIDDKDSAVTSRTYGFYPYAAAADAKACFITVFDGSGRGQSNSRDTTCLEMLNKWVGYDTTDTEFKAFVDKFKTLTAQQGVSLRGEPYWPNPTSNYTAWQNSESQVERAAVWDAMIGKGYYHIWTENPVALSKYISQNFTATSPT